jgi:NitT/TauT family transport system permease protein
VKPSCLFSLLSDLKGIFGTFAFILLVWQSWIVLANVPSIIAPSPLDVFTGLINNWSALLGAAGHTENRTAGSDGGPRFPAESTWHEQHFYQRTDSAGVLVAQSVPVVAMVPVISTIIGYDVRSVIAITVLISFSHYVFSRSK